MDKLLRGLVFLSVFAILFSAPAWAQELAPLAPAGVPHLVQYTGAVTNATGEAVRVKFSLYAAQAGGEVVWTETQTITPDAKGRYAVLLGSATEGGLPQQVFSNAEAKWLGITVGDGAEAPRVVLVATPYSLKASDAETLGGHPVSDFKLATHANAKPDAVDITTVNAGTGITVTGGGTATVTVGLNTAYLDTLGAQFAVLKANNAFTGNQSITGNLLSSGTFTTLNGTSKLAAGGAVDITYANGIYTIALDATQGAAFGNGLWAQLAKANTFTGANTFSSTVSITDAVANNQIVTVNNTSASGDGISATGAESGVVANASDTTSGAALVAQGTAYYGTFSQGGGVGVFGKSPVTGVIAETSGKAVADYGVYASAPSGAGSAIYAVNGNPSGIGGHTYNGAAIWADTDQPFGGGGGNEAALMATAGNNFAEVAINTGSAAAVYAANAGTGYGLEALGGGTAAGAYGYSAGGQGVYGSSGATSGSQGVYGMIDGTGDGVQGYNQSAGGFGLHALSVAGSVTGTQFDGGTFGAALWADTDASAASSVSAGALVATADDNNAGAFLNNSNNSAAVLVLNSGSGGGVYNPSVITAQGRNGVCDMNGAGDVTCTGRMKTAVAVGGTDEKVAVYSVQSAENWFEDFGSAKLENGHVSVTLDPQFARIVNTGVEYHVFITPKGDCRGLFVANETAGSFDVRELGGGESNVAFDYRIVAKRLGLENERLADVTEEMKMATRKPGERAAGSRAVTAERTTPPVAERQVGNPPPMQVPATPQPAAMRALLQHAETPAKR